MKSTTEIEYCARYAFFTEKTARWKHFSCFVYFYSLLPQLSEHCSCSCISEPGKEATHVASLPDPKSYHPTCDVILDRTWHFFIIFDWTHITFCKVSKSSLEEEKCLGRENLWYKNLLASLFQKVFVYFIPSGATSAVTAEKALSLSVSRLAQKLN